MHREQGHQCDQLQRERINTLRTGSSVRPTAKAMISASRIGSVLYSTFQHQLTRRSWSVLQDTVLTAAYIATFPGISFQFSISPSNSPEEAGAFCRAPLATALFTFSSFWYSGEAMRRASSSASFSGAACVKLVGMLPSSASDRDVTAGRAGALPLSLNAAGAPTPSWRPSRSTFRASCRVRVCER